MAAQRSPPGGQRPPIDIRVLIERFLEPLRGRRMPFGGIGGIVVLVLAVVLLWSSWFTVQPEETGVVQRFGKVVRTEGPGLHFKIPYGVETVTLIPRWKGSSLQLTIVRGDHSPRSPSGIIRDKAET